jgi:hypothetical protein
MKWVLVLVVSFGGGNFETKTLGGYHTVAQCHVATTELTWGETMPVNEGIICMKVDK